jgi:uncharacterized membrane protein
MAEQLELPRPTRLLGITTWNLAESLGFPIAVLAIVAWQFGRNPGLLAGLGAVWLTVAIRKLTSGSVPGLLAISTMVLTLQTILAVATGDLWIFLLHFPLANLALCLLFARTARSRNPLCSRLAAELIGLGQPPGRQPGLLRFFQDATWLWAGIFFLLGGCMAVLLVTEPTPVFLLFSAVATITLIAAGVAVSVIWFRSVLHKAGLRVCFVPALLLQHFWQSCMFPGLAGSCRLHEHIAEQHPGLPRLVVLAPRSDHPGPRGGPDNPPLRRLRPVVPCRLLQFQPRRQLDLGVS